MASLIFALEDALEPPTTVILRGDPATCTAWRRAIERAYRPRVQVLDLAREGELPGALSRPHETGEEATAWVCMGTVCLPSINTLDALEKALSGGR
jgi:uncharacterized protein YyaL (SSP411 family)